MLPHRTIIAVTIFLLVSAPTAFAQAKPSATGLDSLSDELLLSELGNRGMRSLLDRAFDANKVPGERRKAYLTLLALRQLTNPEKPPTAKRREELIKEIVAGISELLPDVKDAHLLMRYAAGLITSGVEPEVNKLEYWGENTTTQGKLRPIVEAVVKTLEKCAAEAAEAAAKIGREIRDPNDPRADQWIKLADLERMAQYTRHMTDYYLALSIDASDKRRKEISDAAIIFLRGFDNHDDLVQAQVRLRLAKLHMVKGEYDEAQKLFATVITNPEPPDDIQPAPAPTQQWEARYFAAVTNVLAKKLPDAQKSLGELQEWQKTNLEADENIQKGVAAAASMLQYRIHVAQAAASTDPSARKAEDDKAVAVLFGLLRDQPQLQSIIYEQLMARMADAVQFDTLDPLLLQALVRRGEEERLKPEGETIDEKAIDKAIGAARELVRRKGKEGIPPQVVDSAALLIPVFQERLNRDVEAAHAYLDYVENFGKQNAENAKLALGLAQAVIAELRSKSDMAEDPQVVKAYERFLPIAIGPPFNNKQFAFEYARRLQKTDQFAQAVEYYRQVPPDDKRALLARSYLAIALKQQLDDETKPVAGEARQKVLVELQATADQVRVAASDALQKATTEDDQRTARIMLSRTALLAADVARREQKDANRTLELLKDFETVVQGLPTETAERLMDEALFLRVNSFMALARIDDAVKTLIALLDRVPPDKMGGIVYNLLQKLNDELDKARDAKDESRVKQIAAGRARLAGFLVEWAEKNPNPEIKKAAPGFRVFDATAKHLDAQLEPDADAKKQKLQQTLALFKALDQSNPLVIFRSALIEYDLGNYKQAGPLLLSLLEQRKLGDALKPIDENGEKKMVDNDEYWEGTYKLIKSNVAAARADGDDKMLADTKTYLKRQYAKWGEKVGGKKWRADFETLRKELVPDYIPPKIGEPETPVAGN